MRAAPISFPHTSHLPYVPSSSLAKARSMSSIECVMDRAVAVVLSRSTASVVPSPTRFPNETAVLAGRGCRQSAQLELQLGLAIDEGLAKVFQGSNLRKRRHQG
jgi:hypothetical protein